MNGETCERCKGTGVYSTPHIPSIGLWSHSPCEDCQPEAEKAAKAIEAGVWTAQESPKPDVRTMPSGEGLISFSQRESKASAQSKE